MLLNSLGTPVFVDLTLNYHSGPDRELTLGRVALVLLNSLGTAVSVDITLHYHSGLDRELTPGLSALALMNSLATAASADAQSWREMLLSMLRNLALLQIISNYRPRQFCKL